ncbi:MAG: hypothetical protein ABIH89_06195 [Elusimicrobiota bacterium]
MAKELIPNRDLSEALSVSCELDSDLIELAVDSPDISINCGFSLEEWENFVKAVNDADLKYRELKRLSLH